MIRSASTWIAWRTTAFTKFELSSSAMVASCSISRSSRYWLANFDVVHQLLVQELIVLLGEVIRCTLLWKYLAMSATRVSFWRVSL